MNQGPKGRAYKGREALAALARGGKRGPLYVSHFSTGVVIEPSPEGAKGKVYVVIVDPAEGSKPGVITNGGHYEDVYVKTPAGWRFKSRVFYASELGPSPRQLVSPPSRRAAGARAMRDHSRRLALGAHAGRGPRASTLALLMPRAGERPVAGGAHRRRLPADPATGCQLRDRARRRRQRRLRLRRPVRAGRGVHPPLHDRARQPGQAGARPAAWSALCPPLHHQPRDRVHRPRASSASSTCSSSTSRRHARNPARSSWPGTTKIST